MQMSRGWRSAGRLETAAQGRGVPLCGWRQSVGAEPAAMAKKKHTNSERDDKVTTWYFLERSPTLDGGGAVRAEVAVRLLRRLDEHPAPEHASCSAPFPLLILLLPQQKLTLLAALLAFSSQPPLLGAFSSARILEPDLSAPPDGRPAAKQRPNEPICLQMAVIMRRQTMGPQSGGWPLEAAAGLGAASRTPRYSTSRPGPAS